MVITCPSCQRRFKLPIERVTTRHVKLKCSRCKSVFTHDLGSLAAIDSIDSSAEEQRRVAALPSLPPPAPAPPPAPSKPAVSAAAPAAPRPAAPRIASTQPLVPVPAPPARPVGPPIAPPRPPAAPPKPAAPPPPAQFYEDFGAPPDLDDEHRQALARAQAAAEAEPPPPPEAELPVDVAEPPPPAEAEPSAPEPPPPPAEASATEEALPVEVPPAPSEEPVVAAPARASAPARPSANTGALDLFGSAGASRAAPSVPPAGEEGVLLLDDEQTGLTSGQRLLLAVGVVAVLVAGFFVFVYARNDWKVDFGRFGLHVKRAFGLAPALESSRDCVAAAGPIAAVVHGADGTLVLVRSTLDNTCDRSVSGVAVDCKLEGPGGPWTDEARPFQRAGASDLDPAAMAGRPVSAIVADIADHESTAGVVLPASTHEFWCIFPRAGGSDSRVSQFRSFFEVRVP